ncbi:hypothetical protein CesoFtcFv8_015804 [Champsocephalus esox]|uniref:Uncharacterized protein n=2 Tax=Champsocephalus esox TaxID=159716 RepID=A0AAN8BM46_9TELE|nr:hypothetical protein CesoFtcFv8_015804 [Champsocephalus esox]
MMSKTVRGFFLEVLEMNFNLVILDHYHERNFLSYLMSKEKFLENHPDRQNTEFLNSLFQFPEVYNMIDVTSVFQTGPEVETLQETSLDSNRVEDCDVAITESSQSACKEEPKDEFIEVDLNDDDDIVFVRELMPVDIDVMID